MSQGCRCHLRLLGHHQQWLPSLLTPPLAHPAIPTPSHYAQPADTTALYTRPPAAVLTMLCELLVLRRTTRSIVGLGCRRRVQLLDDHHHQQLPVNTTPLAHPPIPTLSQHAQPAYATACTRPPAALITMLSGSCCTRRCNRAREHCRPRLHVPCTASDRSLHRSCQT